MLHVRQLYQYLVQNKQCREAILWSWAIVSLVIITVIWISIFADSENILATVPSCTAKNVNQNCFLCGSTRAFFSLGQLNISAASASNIYSPLIYSLFLGNSIIFIFCTYKLIKSKFYL